MTDMPESLGLLATLAAGATYGFAAAVQPGPLQAYLISQTLQNGWRRTVPAVFAPILSDIPIIALVLLVLTQIPPILVHVLRLAGGVFLLYLAFGAAMSFRDFKMVDEVSAKPIHQTVLEAVTVNLLNPNPYFGWTLVMGPLLLNAWRQAPLNGVALVMTFYTVLVFTTTALLGIFAGARSLGARVTRSFIGVSALALGVFGIAMIWSGIDAVIH